ncbi:uncharacterized protein LOC105262027 [Musca domestica]|nr:uncharacterized protein LOC105262027 [Musca domestica]
MALASPQYLYNYEENYHHFLASPNGFNDESQYYLNGDIENENSGFASVYPPDAYNSYIGEYEEKDEDYVSIAASEVDEWNDRMFFTTISNIYPTNGPSPDILIPDIMEVSSRRKRSGKYGLNYEIPLSCKRVKSGTEKRVTKG